MKKIKFRGMFLCCKWLCVSLYVVCICMSFLSSLLKFRKSRSGPLSAHCKSLESRCLCYCIISQQWCWAQPAIQHHTWAADFFFFLVESRGQWNISYTHFSAWSGNKKERPRRPQASRKMRGTVFLCGSVCTWITSFIFFVIGLGPVHIKDISFLLFYS